MKILLIDDEKFILSLILRLLNKLGYEDVTTASSGEEALSLMETTNADLIISDLNMPGMDGIELIRSVANIEKKPALILVSGEDKEILKAAERFARAVKLNTLGALKKPIGTESLQNLMDKFEDSLENQKQHQNLVSLTKDEILKGLEDDCLIVAFQPKICMKTGKLKGVETLARWQNADGSILGPGSFIPAAESHGIMAPLTEKVIQASLQDMKKLLEVAPNVKVSINVSVDNLTDLTFADRLCESSKKHGVPKEQLVIEVTESRIMEDVVGPLDILSRLRLKGVGLSIDDFGTGASGFQSLQLLPFTELKIDRAFVDGAPNNEETRAILESIIFVAKKMNLEIVAEGVEKADEWDLLSDLGVDVVQGYYVAKPMLIDDFIGWHSSYENR